MTPFPGLHPPAESGQWFGVAGGVPKGMKPRKNAQASWGHSRHKAAKVVGSQGYPSPHPVTHLTHLPGRQPSPVQCPRSEQPQPASMGHCCPLLEDSPRHFWLWGITDLDPQGGDGSRVGVRWGGVGWGLLQGKFLTGLTICLTIAPTSPSSAHALTILQSVCSPPFLSSYICVSDPGLYSPLAH